MCTQTYMSCVCSVYIYIHMIIKAGKRQKIHRVEIYVTFVLTAKKFPGHFLV